MDGLTTALPTSEEMGMSESTTAQLAPSHGADDNAAALGKPPIPGPGDGQTPVNSNVTLIGGRVLAIVEAGQLPIELDYNLESVARLDFGGTLEGGFTAHPKRDPVTGEFVAMTGQRSS